MRRIKANTRAFVTPLALAGVFSLAGLVAAPPVMAGDEEEMAALMALLESETEVATRNRMNSDFVPGMVSVMQGDDLRALGARNVAEALDRVPGLYVTEGNTGAYRVQVRGVGTTLSGSNIKILLNGMPMNSAVSGASDGTLRIPMSQVDRIVVVRGPGSALYGEYALTGVVDIVLRKDAMTVGVTAGAHSYGQADVIASGGQNGALAWQVNGATWSREETGRDTGTDNFAESPLSNGNSPGEVNDDVAGSVVRTAFDWNDYRLDAVFVENKRGGYFGRNGVPIEHFIAGVEKQVGGELSKRWALGERTDLTVSASTLHTYDTSSAELGIPAGTPGPGGGPPLPEDVYSISDNHGHQSQGEMKLSMALSERNTLLLGAVYADLDVLDSQDTRIRYGVSETVVTGPAARVNDEAARHVRSAYIQDQWRVSDRVELTAGGRYDHYSDWGETVSPRLAAVWQLADAHVLKTQYAAAFRPPTLGESYPGGAIVPNALVAEELASTELSYIYRRAGKILRLTVFRTDIDDLIEFVQRPGQPPQYRNRGEIESRGGELEWEQYLDRRWKLMSNFSWVKAEDTFREDGLVGVAERLANVGLGWDAGAGVKVTGHVRYVGEREGWGSNVPPGQADSFDAYTTFDMTVRWRNAAGMRGLSLLTGGSNLFDADYEVVPHPPQFPGGLTGLESDWWLAAEYQFSP